MLLITILYLLYYYIRLYICNEDSDRIEKKNNIYIIICGAHKIKYIYSFSFLALVAYETLFFKIFEPTSKLNPAKNNLT